MKKILIGFFIFIIFFCFKINVLACSIPPNIINRFFIFEENENVKIKYTIYTWETFKKQIQDDFFKKTGKKLEKENLDIFYENYLKKISKITHNGKELDLKIEKTNFYENLALSDNIFFEIIFNTNLKNFEKENNFYLKFDKNIFSEITSLVHSYLYSEIEETLESPGYEQILNKRYEKYSLKNWEYGIFSEITEENENFMEFSLSIIKLRELENKNEEKNEKQKKSTIFSNNSFSKYFEIFLKNDFGFFGKIFLIIFAIIFGALHGLLPGHSKSIIGAYMMRNKDEKTIKKELTILIFSITLSHSLFIVFLALAIHLLNSGVGTGSYFAHLLNYFLYIIFGIYFTFYAFKKIFFKKNHKHGSCDCCHHKKAEKTGFKNTFLMGIIFGCNPCIDVLILFLLSFSLGNIFYAMIIVLAFSLGLGIILGFLAYFIGKGYNFLNNKNNQIIQNILNFSVLIMGIFIIFLGINGFLAK